MSVMEINRRQLFSFFAGAVALVKGGSSKSISPAASAIQPTCTEFILEILGQTIFPVYQSDGSPSQDHIYYVARTNDGRSFDVTSKSVDMTPLWDSIHAKRYGVTVEPFKSNPDFHLPSMPYHEAFPPQRPSPIRMGGRLRQVA